MSLKDSISDISHKLKTPLTSITIMLDNMLENSQMDEGTRKEFIKDIKREVVNLLVRSATFFDGEEKVVNIAFNIDQDLKEAYLVYKDWDSSIKNSIPIFIKIVPSKLEDIKK